MGRNKKQMFKQIKERLDTHISGWQSKFLSKAGKVVLIKAVAQAIPTYSMSVFQLPKGVCKKFKLKVARYCGGREMAKKGFIGVNGSCCVSIRMKKDLAFVIWKVLIRLS